MRILLTNDDGIYAPGLRALRRELMTLGEVFTVAPATEQSATGHSVTLLTPLLIQQVFDDDRSLIGFAVEGRPADCVKLALLELLPWKPDLIVSGMNAGSNAGINVLYSGTVAAAIEGAFYHHPSIAVSLEYTKLEPLNFPKAATYAISMIRQILETSVGPGSLFNINIPSLEKGPIAGVKIVPQNITAYTERFDRRVDPRGRTYFWAGGDLDCPDPHAETDVTALAESYITITPLQYDLTAHAKLAALRQREWHLERKEPS